MPRACSVSCSAGGPEHALARLVDHELAGLRRERRDDVGARLAARSAGAPSGRRRRCAAPGCRAARLAGGQSDRSAVCASRVCTIGQPRARHAASSAAIGAIAPCSCVTSLPSEAPKPPGSTKSRCMSMTTSAVRPGAKRVREGRRGDAIVDHAASLLAQAHPSRRVACAVRAVCARRPCARRSCGGRRSRPASRRRCGLRSSRRCGRDSSSSSSRSSLTSSTAPPLRAHLQDARVDLGDRGEVEAEHRVRGDQHVDRRRPARAPAPRAARCRPTGSRSARSRRAS